MDERELQARTKRFALRVMKLVDALPHNPSGFAIARQLVRSATSVAANYRAACRGRSRPEFISKLGTVEEEADESALWLELIIDGGLMSATKVRPLHSEATQLVAITATSRITARNNHWSSIANRKSKIENP